MKRLIIYLCLFIVAYRSYAQSALLMMFREKYADASKGKLQCISFSELCDKNRNLQMAEIHGYYACSLMMMAKYHFNPITKFSKFNTGAQLLEKAIRKARGNAELIYLRFTIQTQVPEFLGYNDQIDGDKKFLLLNLQKLQDMSLKSTITSYLKHTKYLNSTEMQSL